ncbi:alpha/beta hydrolase [Methylibium petroleiphilum]|uniref:alpha/beta hydrolase n=1 Tax=Methylibium petroleiphilum TaxID=105560 RepID=UPI001AC0B77F|nr:alpha/beta hydrolase [Methylibium petroleiphilum]MBN9203402.1 alpha/beta hydrolase [Methylibium petroleiphilum]
MNSRRTLLRTGGLTGLALGLTACAPTRVLNALADSDTYTLKADLPYGPDPRQRLDIYAPTRAATSAGHPVALFFYGGSWNNGERADYRFVGEALASRGVLTLIADYRLYPQVSYPDFLRDCAAALAWTLGETRGLGGDAGRVFVMGHSAGAYNAAMLALDPRWLAAEHRTPQQLAGWIGLAGPYDFIPIVNPDVRPVFHHPEVPPESQPIRYADRAAIRSFLGAAAKDSLVDPQRNTIQLARRLESHGTNVTLHLYERVNHVTLAGALARPLRFLAPVLDDVEAFIKQPPMA